MTVFIRKHQRTFLSHELLVCGQPVSSYDRIFARKHVAIKINYYRQKFDTFKQWNPLFFLLVKCIFWVKYELYQNINIFLIICALKLTKLEYSQLCKKYMHQRVKPICQFLESNFCEKLTRNGHQNFIGYPLFERIFNIGIYR